MMEYSILQAGLLLGLYTALAGLYGLLYAAGRSMRSRAMGVAAAIVCGLHLMVLLVVAMCTPLGLGWKVALGGASIALIGIPPLTWTLLRLTHVVQHDT